MTSSVLAKVQIQARSVAGAPLDLVEFALKVFFLYLGKASGSKNSLDLPEDAD